MTRFTSTYAVLEKQKEQKIIKKFFKSTLKGEKNGMCNLSFNKWLVSKQENTIIMYVCNWMIQGVKKGVEDTYKD